MFVDMSVYNIQSFEIILSIKTFGRLFIHAVQFSI